jgi:DNA-binding response OmpR family regulator
MHDEPRTGAPSTSSVPGSSAACSTSGARARSRILLITPEPVLGVALSQYLSEFFAQVALATSVATGCAMASGARTGRYAAIVVDADALDTQALDADARSEEAAAFSGPLARLIAAHPTLRGRIVVLGAPRRELTVGAREVLSKPAPGTELLRAIDDCVGPGLRKALPKTTGAAGARARHI